MYCIFDLGHLVLHAILHWLRLPERVNFKLALVAYRVLNGMAPPYLNQLVLVSSRPGLSAVIVHAAMQYRLSTAGRRSFPVAASIFWNTVPDDVQSAPSVSSFQQHAAKDIPVSPVISRRHSLNSVLCYRGLCNS